MASRSLGTLTLDLIARIGGFEKGMDAAERKLDNVARTNARRSKEIAAAWNKAWNSISVAGIAATAAVAATFAGLNKITDGLSKFQEFADQMGDTAEAVASLRLASNVSGVAFEEITAASVKLTSSLTKVDDDSKAAGAAIKALGLDLNTFKQLAPAAQLEAVAKAMGKFEDGAGKTAVAVDLFGRSGAQIIPFLKDLNDYGTKNAMITKDQIEQADKLSKSLAVMRSNMEDVSLTLGSKLIPMMNRLVENYKDLQELGGFDLILKDAAKGFIGLDTRLTGNVGADINRLLKERADLEAQMKADTRQTPGLQDDWKERIGDINRYLELLRRRQIREALLTAGGDNGDAVSRRYLRPDVLNYSGTPDKPGKSPFADSERYLDNLKKQLEATKDLTVYEQLLTDIQEGRLGKVTPETLASLKITAQQIDAARAAKEALEGQQKAMEGIAQMQARVDDAALAGVESLYASNQALRDEIELIGKEGDALTQVELTRNAANLARAEEELLMARNNEASATVITSLEREIALLKQRAGLITDRAAAQGAAEEIKKQQEFYAQAYKNIQDGFGQTFLDMMNGNFKNIGDGFLQLINKMVAEALAADLANALFGTADKSGGRSGGLVGDLFGSFLGSIFGGGRANGGFVAPQMLYEINEVGAEALQPGEKQYRINHPARLVRSIM